MRNPLYTLRSLTQGEEKMAYETASRDNPSAIIGGQLLRQRTFREQIRDQIAHHKAKITDLENVLDSMTPEVEKFVEALQKVNL